MWPPHSVKTNLTPWDYKMNRRYKQNVQNKYKLYHIFYQLIVKHFTTLKKYIYKNA